MEQSFKTFEEFLHVNPGMNVPGVGPVTLPGNPGSMDSFASQSTGSGYIDPVEFKKKKKKKKKIKFKSFNEFFQYI